MRKQREREREREIYIYIYIYIIYFIDAWMRQDCANHILVEHASIFYEIIARGLLNKNLLPTCANAFWPKTCLGQQFLHVTLCFPACWITGGMLSHGGRPSGSGSAWNSRQASGVCEFCPWQLASSAVGRVVCSLL